MNKQQILAIIVFEHWYVPIAWKLLAFHGVKFVGPFAYYSKDTVQSFPARA